MAIPYDPVNDFFGGLNKPTDAGTPSGGSVVNDFFSQYPAPQVNPVQPVTPQPIAPQTGIFNQARTFIEQMGKKLVEKVVPKKLPSGNILKITLPSKVTTPKKTGLQPDFGEQKVSAPSAQMTEEGRFRYSEEGQAQIFKKTQDEIKSKIRPVKSGYKEPGIFGSIVESIKEGTVSMLSGLGATTEMVGKMSGQIALIEAGQKIFKESEKILAGNPEWGEAPDAKWSPTKVARLVAGAAPSLLATTAAMLASGGLGAFAVGFGMEAGQTYKESKEAGVPEGKAQLYGSVVGTINGILEKAFPEKLLTPVKGSVKETVQKISKSLAKDLLEKAGKFGIRFTKSGVMEGSTEALQQLWSNVIAINYDKNRPLWSGLLESFVGGFGSGGIAGGIVQEKSLPPGEYTAQEVIDKVISSPLQDTPEGKELLKSAIEAKQQDKNIVIESPAEKLQEKPIEGVSTVGEVAKKRVEALKQKQGKGEAKIPEGFVEKQIVPEESVRRVLNTKETQALQSIITDEMTKIRELSKTPKDMMDALTKLYEDVTIKAKEDKVVLSSLRTAISKEMFGMAGSTGNYKSDYANLQTMIKEDPDNGPILSKMEDYVMELDKKLLTAKEVMQPKLEKEKKVTEKRSTTPSKEEPVGTGKLKESRLFKRVKATLGEEYDQKEIKYNELSLDKQAESVVDLISDDPEKAVRIAKGYEEPPQGITQNAISVALAETARDKQDFKTAADLWTKTSLRSTRLGQEIVSLRGAFDANEPLNAVKKLLNIRMERVTKRYNDIIKSLALSEDSTMAKKVDALVTQEAKKVQKMLTKAQKSIQSAQEIINALKCK